MLFIGTQFSNLDTAEGGHIFFSYIFFWGFRATRSRDALQSMTEPWSRVGSVRRTVPGAWQADRQRLTNCVFYPRFSNEPSP